MDVRTLDRRIEVRPIVGGTHVSFALHGEIGVMSCIVTMAVSSLTRVGVDYPYSGKMVMNAYVSTHRHYPRNPLEKWQETTCAHLEGHCYGRTWTDGRLAVKFAQGDIDGIWKALELAYERWWRSVKNDSETEDRIYTEVE